MSDIWHKLSQLSHSAATRLHVKSALNPMLWMIAISTPLSFGVAYLFKDNDTLATLLIIVGIIPIIVACFGFLYFALVNPEKLQSEDYQIRHESLQIIQQKGQNLELSEASIEQIANPTLNQIEHKEEEA